MTSLPSAASPASGDARARLLAERYGAPRPRRRLAVVLVAGLVGAIGLGWLGWTAWSHSTPEVDSALVSFTVLGQHSATAVVDVRLRDEGVEATCRLRAYAADHMVVGESTFAPDPSRRRQSAQVRTERAATSLELVGCTAPGQSRPR